MARQLTNQQRQQARRLRREGKSVRETAVAIGCSLRTVTRLTRGHGRRESGSIVWSPGAGHLSLAEREEISRGLSVGDSLRDLQSAATVGALPYLVLTGKGFRTQAAGGLPEGTLVFTDLAAVVAELAVHRRRLRCHRRQFRQSRLR